MERWDAEMVKNALASSRPKMRTEQLKLPLSAFMFRTLNDTKS